MKEKQMEIDLLNAKTRFEFYLVSCSALGLLTCSNYTVFCCFFTVSLLHFLSIRFAL